MLLALGVFFMPALAMAEKKVDPVSVYMEAFKIIIEKGVEHQRPADAANPDDVIEYIAHYTNNTDATINNLKATLPIPVGMELISKTLSPKGAQASLDGAVYKNMPLTRKVKLPSGKWEVQPIPYKEYRFLRWNLKTLDAGKEKVVSAQVRVAPLDDSTSAKEER